METVQLLFPVPATKQSEIRLNQNRAGIPVEATIPAPQAVTRQSEIKLKSDRVGLPVTAMFVVPFPLKQAELRSCHDRSGNPITASLVSTLPLRQTALRLKHDSEGSPVGAVLAFRRLPTQSASIAWKAAWQCYATATISFRNDYHNIVTSPILYRYDWKTVYGSVMRYRHRSLVRGGWRIVAKNLETNEVHELGFIDADQSIRSLENVSLPDGDYEISVLTSSLFWKDAMDGNVRTISVRPGEEISPLPVIYNLRSSISLGTRTILWSASKSEIDECLFGIWYSSESPVDTNRTPDATVWYSASMTEYQTSFAQNAPAWVAVAAMLLDEENQIGKVHELYLDWSSVPPRAPDDVIVLSEPLPAMDSEIMDRAVEEEDLALVF